MITEWVLNSDETIKVRFENDEENYPINIQDGHDSGGKVMLDVPGAKELIEVLKVAISQAK